MRLYSFLKSPNPVKVRLAFAELELESEVDYQTTEIDLFTGKQKAESFLGLNPQGKVPVLDDGGLILRESNAILAHLGKKFGKLWPSDLESESQALQWLFFESAHLTGSCGKLWWNRYVVPPAQLTDNKRLQIGRAIKDLKRPLDLLESHLASNPFMLGEEFSLVDCSIGVALLMVQGTELDGVSDGQENWQWPQVESYRQRIKARSSWAKAQGDAIFTMLD